MSGISRRHLLTSGCALGAATLLSRSTIARAAALTAENLALAKEAQLAANLLRDQLLMDAGWKFALGHASDPARDFGFGASQNDFSKTGDFKISKRLFDDSKWRTLNLPHDWAVELPFIKDETLRSHGFKPLGRHYPETSVGWYRREFEIPQSDLGRRISVEFDGVFRSALVFVNGCYAGRNDAGYTSFSVDVTDYLNYGGKNIITLRVDVTMGDGWFYEGAGIYRHVWLLKTNQLHLTRWESTVRTHLAGPSAALSLATMISNDGDKPVQARAKWKIFDAAGSQLATAESAPQWIAPDQANLFHASTTLPHPVLWSIEEPHLYTAIVTVESEGKTIDEDRTIFGVRTTIFDPEKGFLLNGKPVKIMGTCNHQDHAGVGVAMPDRLQYFRLAVLKEMGSNGVRTSHNMPTPEWVEACDRMGMVMMCETRQMNSNPEAMAQLETMIKRYRNAPSIILWSIGNEEDRLQTGQADQGENIAGRMVRRCHELDPTRVASAAVNGKNDKGVSVPLDIIGFNYHLEFPDDFHKKNPTRPIYGSETSSVVSTRGIYVTDRKHNWVESYERKSQLGLHGGPQEWWEFYAKRAWDAGGFAWTGFDYRGEPTPYGWPSISSQFGIVDTCGFPKDSYYYYKAWWGKDPVVHVFPHWNFEGSEGKEIAVWVYSNLEEVELVHNGSSLGRQKVPQFGHVQWSVKYAPGSIEARGWKDGKMVLADKRETVGPGASIRLTADRTEIDADGEDLSILTVDVLDKEGRAVPIASDRIQFKVTGEGALIGVGNGDPNCQESDKEPKRSLFSGLAQVILQSTTTTGEIVVEAMKDGIDGAELKPARLVIKTRYAKLRPALPVILDS